MITTVSESQRSERTFIARYDVVTMIIEGLLPHLQRRHKAGYEGGATPPFHNAVRLVSSHSRRQSEGCYRLYKDE